LEFLKDGKQKGDLVYVDPNGENSLLTIVDNCGDLSRFITLNGKINLTSPNYAFSANSAQLIELNGKNFIIGDGDYRSSYLDQMFNYKPNSEQTDFTEFMNNRDYMISEDFGSLLFLAPVEKNIIKEKLSSKISRMTSFISATAVKENELFLAGTIDRDRAFIWKISANALQ
jgi:hypothetical protein